MLIHGITNKINGFGIEWRMKGNLLACIGYIIAATVPRRFVSQTLVEAISILKLHIKRLWIFMVSLH
jgi:hypothetical protein